VIAALVFLMGVTIRHWFNTTHARKGRPTWTWVATIIIFILIMWLSTVPKVLTGETDAGAETVAPAFQQFAGDVHFPAVKQLVSTRCSMCHAAEPVYEGLARPRKRRGNCRPCARDLYTGRTQPRDAARQRDRHHA
jgi:uncharacterized membrane protein